VDEGDDVVEVCDGFRMVEPVGRKPVLGGGARADGFR
jgi:hypothetical protein